MGTTDDESQLWVMASIAFAIFYGNYMVAPLIPAFSNEFSVAAQQLGWGCSGLFDSLRNIDACVWRMVGLVGTRSDTQSSSVLCTVSSSTGRICR